MIDEKKLIEEIEEDRTAFRSELYTDDSIREYFVGAINEQPKLNEWIPCSERLPKCNGVYLTWRPRFFGGEIGMPSICYFDGQDTWHDSYGVDFTRILNSGDVVAWMELPEPYREGVK